MRLSIAQIASCVSGRLAVEPPDVSRVATGLSWDSRQISAGEAYVALPGERADGHDFAAAALRAGAVCALVMRPPSAALRALAAELGAGVVEVPDTVRAVTALAEAWRARLDGRVIALSGSSGKTTTKNLVRDVLARELSVRATAGNENNELGVPKTLLAADRDTQALVVEMGMRGAGQIGELCACAHPEWGLISNVGESHIELLGSRENIARAKAELFCALPDGAGRAFVNAADDFADFVRACARLDERQVEILLFDGSPLAAERRAAMDAREAARPAVWASDVALDDQGRPGFLLHASGFGGRPAEECLPCRLSLRGLHNVSNACAAAAVGRASGVGLASCVAALGASQPEAGRQELLHAPSGVAVVNDAYNANPDSMRAALSMFCALGVSGRRVAVLGDMAELGAYAPDCHARLGVYAASLPIDRLVCVGEFGPCLARAAEGAGMDSKRIACVGSPDAALEELDGRLEAGDAVLVKASRCMGLERVVEGLVI